MATRPLLEPAACPVFAPYIEELHEFLATCGVPFGLPADLTAVVDRLRQPGPFSDDLSSLLRSIVLREGGVMPNQQLLEILTLAVGGPEAVADPQRYREPLRQLLAFVAGAMRRPWNMPPVERAEIVPFPANAQATPLAAVPAEVAESAASAPIAGPIAPPPTAIAAAPRPGPAGEAEPHRPPTFLRDLLIAAAGAVAFAAVLVLADSAHKPIGNQRAGSLTTITHRPASQSPPMALAPPGQIPQPLFFTGTTHPPKPSAYGEPLQPHSAHRFRTPAPVLSYSGPNPTDSAASPGAAAQPAPAEPPQTTASPVDSPSDPGPTR
jgi:hypothetical protein